MVSSNAAKARSTGGQQTKHDHVRSDGSCSRSAAIPNTKLGKRELFSIPSSSRVIVRQAVNELSDGKLVNLQRHMGVSIANPALGGALEICDAVTVVEHRVGLRIGELRQFNERQRKATEEGSLQLAHDLGRIFHSTLVQFGRNRQIADFYELLVRQDVLLSNLCTDLAPATLSKTTNISLILSNAVKWPRSNEPFQRTTVSSCAASTMTKSVSRRLSWPKACGPCPDAETKYA